MRRIDDIDVTLLERKFHWPSDADQIWRHFTDYFLVKATTTIFAILMTLTAQIPS
jgi:hypothetical protein